MFKGIFKLQGSKKEVQEKKEVPEQKDAPVKKAKKSKKAKYISEVMEATGWSKEQATEQMEDAKNRIGISYKDYNSKGFYDIPVELQEGKYQKLLNKRELRKERKEKCIADAMEKCGWEREYAVEQIEDARKRTGITYKEYMDHEFFLIPVEQQDEKYQAIQAEKQKEKAENREQKRQERKRVISEVMAATGWDHDQTKANIEEAKNRTGCTYNEYLMYKFYELDVETQNQVFLMDLSKQITAKYTVNRTFGRMLCDKAATNVFFDKYVRRPWCINTNITEEEFVEKFKDCKKVVYKPLGGNWGRGVEGFEINEDNAREIFAKLVEYPEGVIEQFVVQHPEMSALSPTAVNTVRVVSISSNTQPITADGKKMDIAYASLKIGGVKSSIVDNLHGGGMVAAIGLESGELITEAADDRGNVFSTHPVTGTQIKGFKVPYFKEAIEMVKEAITEKKLDGYLGWDIAITENGPVLIETNLTPGVILFSMPYIATEKRGMKHVMEKYL